MAMAPESGYVPPLPEHPSLPSAPNPAPSKEPPAPPAKDDKGTQLPEAPGSNTLLYC